MVILNSDAHARLLLVRQLLDVILKRAPPLYDEPRVLFRH